MLESIAKLKDSFDEALKKVADNEDLEKLRIAFLGKKGAITDSMKELKNLDNEAKKEFGKEINVLKDTIDEAIRSFADRLANAQIEKQIEQAKTFDFTVPSAQPEGSLHPITLVQRRIEDQIDRIDTVRAQSPWLQR